MEKTKLWHKDHVNKFSVGDKVVVFRRKKNGHPKALKDGVIYTVKEIIGDDLMISNGLVNYNLHKIHKTYLINVEWIRDEIINQLLKD